MKKQIIGILVFMLMVATVIPAVSSINSRKINIILEISSNQPLKLENWTEIQKLLASDGTSSDYFGCSVSISDNTSVIGARRDDSYRGSAYVFKRSGTSWTQEAKLVASDGTRDDNFGCSVSISGDTAIIGAYGDDSYRGSAYVFKRSGTSWTQEAKLIATDGTTDDNFGWSVSISGDTAVIGADGDVPGGSAYVFKRTGTSWTQEAKFIATDSAAYDNFGHTVSISDDTAVIGADGDDDNGDHSGSAYVFKHSDTSWTQEAKIIATDGTAYDNFGCSVSISGDTAVIGARYGDSTRGSAYVFKRSGTSWAQEAKIIATDGAAYVYFGHSVSISDDTAIIGAYGDEDNGNYSGSAYVFKRSGTSWAQEAKLVASDGVSYDLFGISVYISGDTAIIGADGDYPSGSAYIFKRTGTSWTQEDKLFTSAGAAGDDFGVSVSISDDTAVIRAAVIRATCDDSDLGSALMFSREKVKIN